MLLSRNRNKVFVFIIFLFFGINLFSQLPEQQTYKIASISIEGAISADEGTIKALSGLRIGDELTIPGDDKLQTAIRNLWMRKQFSDVQIVIDRITAAGLFLIIKVEEFPRLSEIDIEYNDELSDEDLVSEIGKIRGDIITGYDVYLAKKKVRDLYSEEGLMFAKVESEIIPTDTASYYKLILTVDEGAEFYVTSVEFEGNVDYDDDELADVFDDTHTKAWWQFWRSSKFDKIEYQNDLKLLKGFYKNNGYMDAEILRDTIIYDDVNETIAIKVKVHEGPKVFIRDIKFSGSTIYPADVLLKRLDFEPGSPYDLETFEMNLQGNEDQTDVKGLYMDNGYLMAQLNKVETRVTEDSVDLEVKIFEGERVTIRRVDIVGNTKTKDKVIRRELYTKPGDYFSRSAIIRSVRALGVLNYFNPEALRPDVKPVGSDNTKVDVLYNVEERSTDTFNASVGFAGSFGLTGALGMTFNNFSLLEPLRGGGGQIFNFTWEFGQASRYQTFSLGFTEPWLFDEPTTIGFNLFDTKYNWNYYLRRRGIAMNIGRRFKWPDDYFRMDWSLRIQENDVKDISSNYYRPGVTTEITVGQKISRISLDNLFFPTSGSRFSFSSNLAMGVLGLGNTDYFKNELSFELLNPLMKVEEYNRLVLYLSSKIGYITGFESDSTIPPIDMYYMGGNGLAGFGVTPLRGYEDRAIGPQNGGRVMAKHAAELRFAISVDPMPVYVYAFAEAGNVWTSLRETDPFNLKRSFGLGIQLMINPIGVIGFSYGYGVDEDRTGKVSGWKFLFHLGQ